MRLAVFDVGGTEIKYCSMDESLRCDGKGSVATPLDSREHFFEVLKEIFESFDLEKLRLHFQKHPATLSRNFNLKLQFAVRNINISENDYYSLLKPIILYQSRIYLLKYVIF